MVEASLNGRPLELRSGQAKVSADQIRSGENVLLVRSGGGVVFASAVLSYFTSDLEAAAARVATPRTLSTTTPCPSSSGGSRRPSSKTAGKPGSRWHRAIRSKSRTACGWSCALPRRER